MPGIGAVARDAAPPIRPSRGRREDHIAEAQTTTAHKKRRMIQIGSSPPPFITSLPHSTSHARPYRLVAPSRPADRADAVEPSATSPKAAKRRRIVVVRKKNPLELRSSSPASPPPSEHVSLTRHSTAPQAPRSRTMSETATETSRRLLQRKPHLDRSDPSSPIGTFGGQMVRCFDRSPGPSRIGSADFASTLNARTVGLHPLNQATRTRARATTRSRPLQETHRSTVPANENALSMPPDVAGRRRRGTSKQIAENQSEKQKRTRSKIHRVRLGGAPSASPTEQPLIDADHQLNSQPDDAELQQTDALDAADESEISYFPTLPPTRLLSERTRNTASLAAHQPTADPALTVPNRSLMTTPPSAAASSRSRPAQNDTQHIEEEDLSEGDASMGLFGVLSQSAIRNMNRMQAADVSSLQRSVSARRDPPQTNEAQHQVCIDFDTSHYTHAQAKHIASSMIGTKARRSKWSAVHPDTVTDHQHSSRPSSSTVSTVLQAAWRPPSSRVVARQLGLTAKQMVKSPMAELQDFVHSSSAITPILQEHDDEGLEPFVHSLSYAGYRFLPKLATHSSTSSTTFSQCQPFNDEAFQSRIKTRRKEVVKIIIPFSDPPLSTHATRARFVTPNPHTDAPIHGSSTNGVMLVWMQSTARSFLRALETMLHAGFALSTAAGTESASTYNMTLDEVDLWPCPILHYVTHAGSTGSANDGKVKPSYVALYVHLDRVVEARRRLADVELNEVSEESYRPFGDPLLRLLVTSLRGESLCLI